MTWFTMIAACGRLVLAERRIGRREDRGDPSAQRIAERLAALDDAGDHARERDRRVAI